MFNRGFSLCDMWGPVESEEWWLCNFFLLPMAMYIFESQRGGRVIFLTGLRGGGATAFSCEPEGGGSHVTFAVTHTPVK